MPNRVSSEWCSKTSEGSPTWKATPDEEAVAMFCDSFWNHFDWNEPEPGEEMRIVFCSRYVRGAQRSMFMPEYKSEWLVPVLHDFSYPGLVNGCLILYTPIDYVLNSLFDRSVIPDDKSVAVWWWPEYRAGG